MHHLHAEITHARLAQRADLFADGELLLLARIEVEEAQEEDAAVILQLADQAAPRAISHFAVDDLALHLHARARDKIGDAPQRGLILVAQRQMQHQIEALVDAEFGEPGNSGFGNAGRKHVMVALVLYYQYSIHFHQCAARQRRHTHRCTGRVGRA